MNSSQPTFSFQTAWSKSVSATPRGLALVRERDWVLAWDQNHWLHLFDHAGHPQGQVHFPGTLVAACCADDGSAYAAVGNRGEIHWLAPDLTTRWQYALPSPAVTVAMDPFGQYVAVSDNLCNVHLFNRLGRPGQSWQTPRPLHHLAMVATSPVLVGCADYGLVTSFDMAGACRWRDGLVAHAGSLGVSGDGQRILIACFSEGVQSYNLDGEKQPRLSIGEPCRLAAVAFTGRFVLAAGMTNRLMVLDGEGQALASQLMEKPIAAAALGALGDYAVVALAEGRVVRLNIQKKELPGEAHGPANRR
jgi:hypothetical protein